MELELMISFLNNERLFFLNRENKYCNSYYFDFFSPMAEKVKCQR